MNAQQAANGTLGLVLALQPGQTIPAGRQALVELTFNVAANAAATALIDPNSSPVLEEVTDVNARRLPALFVGRSFPVQLPVGFGSTGVEIADGQPRFTFGNSDGTAVTADQLNNLEVYATSNLGGSWTRLENALQLVNGRVRIVDPAANNGLRFYQVRR
ncbi:MAG: hypothetical protein ACPGVU_20505, partial [Limisphaerales bacterium]